MRCRRSASLAAAASRCSAFHTGTSSTVAVCSVCVYGLLAMRCARGFAARRACGAMGSKRKTIDSFFTPADSAPKSKVAAHADSPKQPVHPSSPPQPVHPPKPAPTSPRQPLHPVSAPQHPVHPPSAGGASTSTRVDAGATSCLGCCHAQALCNEQSLRAREGACRTEPFSHVKIRCVPVHLSFGISHASTHVAPAHVGADPAAAPLSSLITEASWQPLVQRQSSQLYWSRLEKFVQRQRQAHTVFPPRDLTFRALNSVPLDSVRVVILGQVRASARLPSGARTVCATCVCLQSVRPVPPLERATHAGSVSWRGPGRGVVV